MNTTIHFSQTKHHEVNMLFSRGVSGLLMYLLAHEDYHFYAQALPHPRPLKLATKGLLSDLRIMIEMLRRVFSANCQTYERAYMHELSEQN